MFWFMCLMVRFPFWVLGCWWSRISAIPATLTHTHKQPVFPFPVPLSPSPMGSSFLFPEFSELSLLLAMLC